MTTIETTFRRYSFDIRTAEGKEDWRLFTLERQSDGAKIMGPVYHTASPAERALVDGQSVTLETAHLFDNQWNTAEGVRVFDWLLEAEMPHAAATIGAPRGIKRGHYLDQRAAMHKARETLKCGYCGHMEPSDSGLEFCPKCIGSEYLTAKDLPLTRLQAVSDQSSRAPLTDAEQAERFPIWQAARLETANTQAGRKIAAFRAKIDAAPQAAFDKEAANSERMRWLLDNGFAEIAMANAIYYNHTGLLSFGWRDAIPYANACDLMGRLSDAGMPYAYDVVTSDRGKLSGAVLSDAQG